MRAVYIAVGNDNNPGSWTILKDGSPVLLSDVGTGGIRDPSLIVAPDHEELTPGFQDLPPPAESYVSLGMDNTIALDSEAELYYMTSKNGPGDSSRRTLRKASRAVVQDLGGDWQRAGRGRGGGPDFPE